MAIRMIDTKFIFHKYSGNGVYFEIANQDTTDATYQYFGYVSSEGSWIVQRLQIIGSAIIFRYKAGQKRSDYDALWDSNGLYIGSLTFITFDQIEEVL